LDDFQVTPQQIGLCRLPDMRGLQVEQEFHFMGGEFVAPHRAADEFMHELIE
jgi:hypothetical protein